MHGRVRAHGMRWRRWRQKGRASVTQTVDTADRLKSELALLSSRVVLLLFLCVELGRAFSHSLYPVLRLRSGFPDEGLTSTG